MSPLGPLLPPALTGRGCDMNHLGPCGWGPDPRGGRTWKRKEGPWCQKHRARNSLMDHCSRWLCKRIGNFDLVYSSVIWGLLCAADPISQWIQSSIISASSTPSCLLGIWHPVPVASSKTMFHEHHSLLYTAKIVTTSTSQCLWPSF